MRNRVLISIVLSVAVVLIALVSAVVLADVANRVPEPTREPTRDPYETYQRLAPAKAPPLSREDAQTRALLGCGQDWAPGTVDAALAQAYADLCTK